MTTITQEPREIAFDAIRKGDLIRLEYDEFGIKSTRRGEAFERRPDGAWYTSEGGYVAAPFTTGTILLLHRPAPGEPEGLGAIVRTVEGLEYISVNRMPGTRRWVNAGLHEGGNRWALKWADLYHDDIEVLSEENEEES